MLKVKNLTEGSLTRHLYKLALPIMGTSFVHMAFSFTDMAWLGRLGSREVAAVGIISVFLWIAHSMSHLTKTGSEVNIAQAIGREDYEAARAYASHNATMSLGVGIGLALLYALLATPLIGLYSPTEIVADLAHEYMYVVLLCLPAIFFNNTLFGIYNATGNSVVPFWALSLGMLCNMVLDPIFIHSLGWGVSGAAWATVISEYIILVLFTIRLRRWDKLLGNFPFFCRLHWRTSWDIIKIGLPAAGLNILFACVTIIMGRLASRVGGDVGIAVLTSGGQLEAITWSTAQGATTALSTIVAQNYAAHKWQRVWAAYGRALVFTLGVGVAGMLFFIFGGEWLFRLIVPDEATVSEGKIYLGISAYSQVMMMLELTTQGLLYGLGRSYLPASISIAGNALRIPLALMLIGLGWGLSSVWWAISLSAALKGLLALVVVLYIYKRKQWIAS